MTIPVDADVASFLISDGKLATKELVLPKLILLADLFERYRTGIPEDALAAETLRIAAIRFAARRADYRPTPTAEDHSTG